MKQLTGITLGITIMLATFIGCSQQPEKVVIDKSKYMLTTEPAGAQEVIAAKKESQADQEIKIVGRIGGSVDPWVKDRAAFTIVDSSLQACSDIDGDTCKMPWDYCCATDQLPEATALVQFVDEQGAILPEDSRKLFDVKELNTVVVKGVAKKDDAGNLTVLASGMFVRK